MTNQQKEFKKIEESLTHLITLFENRNQSTAEIEAAFKKGYNDVYYRLKNFITYYNYDSTIFGDIFNSLDRIYQDFYECYDKNEIIRFSEDFKTRIQGTRRLLLNT